MTPAVILLSVLLAAPMTADLGGFLERSGAAEFSGEQLVACQTPDGSRESVFEMAQVDGSVVAWASESDQPILTLGPGVAVAVTGDQVAATVVEGTSLGDDSPAYEIGQNSSVTFLGREATEVSILRNGTERVVLTVDDQTDAVVRTRTSDGEGDLYCDRRFISFQPDVGDIPVLEPGETESVEPLGDPPDVLPATVSGFRLVDTYAVEDGTLSYYTDGFFSFGVVLTDRSVGFPTEAEITTIRSGGGVYRRAYEAGRVTVAWTADADSVALIGDLPPDLTESVLADLPRPQQPGFLDRLWSRLFG